MITLMLAMPTMAPRVVATPAARQQVMRMGWAAAEAAALVVIAVGTTMAKIVAAAVIIMAVAVVAVARTAIATAAKARAGKVATKTTSMKANCSRPWA